MIGASLMAVAVEFHRKLLGGAIEIKDVISQGVLSSEFEISKETRTNCRP